MAPDENKGIYVLLKVLASFAALVAAGFTGLIVLVIAALGGAKYFDQGLIVAAAVLAAIVMLALIWRPFSRKARLISLGAAAAALALCFAGSAIYSAYDAGVETVAEPDRLWLYNPFAADTLAAELGEPCTFKITESPPRLDGATALYPLYAAFVRAVYEPGLVGEPYFGDAPSMNGKIQPIEEVLACTRTGDAYKRLIAGDADIIFAAAPSSAQLEAAKQAGVELKLTPIGREAFVFFVNARNPVSELTSEQVRGIYSGEITNWRELGGKSGAIRAFQRPENSGSQTALVNFMGDETLMQAPMKDIQGAMGGIIHSVASYKNYKNAIGYTFLFYATEMVGNDSIKLITLDGIAPTRENIANGTYSSSSTFYAVTAGTENENVQALIDWVLSPQGQQLVEQTGYTRLK